MKLTFPPAAVRVNGLGGNDMIMASGSFGSLATTVHLDLFGGAGNDVIQGGLLAGDHLTGNEGNDSFFSADGQPGDNVTGGTGVDTATVDTTDQAFGVEKFQQPIGKLQLSPSIVVAKQGAATARLTWTHPTSWKQLRTITLAAYDGTRRVGSISISPKSGKLTGRGALRLDAHIKLTHASKTVTAKFGLNIAPAALGTRLRLQVEATDTAGHHEVEPAAGLLKAKPRS